ncbi:MAG TPA: phenylalanine--tRNA ligase subunit beta [Vicinamibacterales bacterium]
MRIPLGWLRDFVDVDLDARALADALAMRGFETASVDPLPASPQPPWAKPAADAVIDLEITANRPDCLSILGIARETATMRSLALRLLGTAPGLERKRLTAGESDAVSVTIEAPDLCPRYAAAVAEVTIGPSPAWLAARLEAAGVRSINNIVDITNYVLMEIGQPTHAFDLERLGGRALRIRRARAGETITTLDGMARTLDPEILVIADAERAQAVAGVMGGGHSEVASGTTRVVFESAYFEPTGVRRTSKRLGLMTEASARFERGGDVNATIVALERIAALLESIGAGRVVGPLVDRYPVPRSVVRIRLRRQRLHDLLGVDVEDEEVVRIFEGLGFATSVEWLLEVAPEQAGWDVTIPSFRVDVKREADLVEEIGRHYGYDRLPAVFPAPQAPPAPSDPRVARDEHVRRILLAAGLNEAVTYTFVERGVQEAFGLGDAAEVVGIANPLSGKFDVLRRSLLPGLVEAVAHNRRHERRDIRLFEIGARFSASQGENHAVAIAWTGAGADPHWSRSGRDVDFFDVKGLVEQVAGALGLSVTCEPTKTAPLAAGRAATIVVDGAQVGAIGQIDPAIAAARDLPSGDAIYVAELDLDALWAARLVRERTAPGTTRVASLPRYPSVVRDLSLIVDERLPASTVRGTILAHAPEGLVDVEFFDRYQGKGIPDAHVSLSLRLTFRSPERTLTDADVQQGVDAVLGRLGEVHGAVQR